MEQIFQALMAESLAIKGSSSSETCLFFCNLKKKKARAAAAIIMRAIRTDMLRVCETLPSYQRAEAESPYFSLT